MLRSVVDVAEVAIVVAGAIVVAVELLGVVAGRINEGDERERESYL